MKTSARAFTLIEILVVLGIIGMLVAIMFRGVGGSYDKAQVKVAKIFIQAGLRTSLEKYKLDMGSYPSTAEGLAALLTAPANAADNWHGPYAEADGGKLQLDPWNEPYQYRFPGTHNKTKYDLFSKGPDKSEGTEDDIGNW
jgi:general secretion pathway protein G